MIDAESKFEKDNGSILNWITTTWPKRYHDLLCQRLGVNDTYGDCGKWLFEHSAYRGWKEARDASKPVLWLRGTGRQYSRLQWFPFKDANVHHSGDWKDYFDVRQIPLAVELLIDVSVIDAKLSSGFMRTFNCILILSIGSYTITAPGVNLANVDRIATCAFVH